MYPFKIEKELIDKARKEAKKLSMAISTFIRQGILEKSINSERSDELEERLEKLGKK